MRSIFISYRRDDSAGYAGRLADNLAARFGSDEVFQDIEAIRAGDDFVRAIDTAIGACRVVIVLIGDGWLDAVDGQGRRRLDDPHDFVRAEVAAALQRGVPTIPVLIEGARMPASEALPQPLRALARIQALELSDSRWDYDVAQLVAAIERVGRVASTGGRRRVLALSIAALAIAAGVGWSLWPRSRRIDLSGTWALPDGRSWVIAQQGERVIVEEIHPDTQEAWRRGEGTLRDDALRLELRYAFSPGPVQQLTLVLSEDGRTLNGKLDGALLSATRR